MVLTCCIPAHIICKQRKVWTTSNLKNISHFRFHQLLKRWSIINILKKMQPNIHQAIKLSKLSLMYTRARENIVLIRWCVSVKKMAILYIWFLALNVDQTYRERTVHALFLVQTLLHCKLWKHNFDWLQVPCHSTNQTEMRPIMSIFHLVEVRYQTV